jgi:serine/threonine protein phosphatase PrpC
LLFRVIKMSLITLGLISNICAVIFSPSLQLSGEPPLSFYGVYDGHAGKDAAAFAASHLHCRILTSENFPQDPIKAIKEAFVGTDQDFLDKGEKEVRLSTFITAWFCFINLDLITRAFGA